MLKKLFSKPFHVVDVSPWPFCSAVGFFLVTSGSVWCWHGGKSFVMVFGLLYSLACGCFWWSDVKCEKFLGSHSSSVSSGLRSGMCYFILSEVLFFMSFFWAYLHYVLKPDWEMGLSWPPFQFEGMIVDPFAIPLLKTVLLLSSGATVTWSHHSLVYQKKSETWWGLVFTVLFGLVFMGCQLFEYLSSSLSFNSSVYGSSFFMLTGFHGAHVIVGTTLLMFCLFRTINNKFSSLHHVGFECAMWYWHFVDVVWMFLVLIVYWFGFV